MKFDLDNPGECRHYVDLYERTKKELDAADRECKLLRARFGVALDERDAYEKQSLSHAREIQRLDGCLAEARKEAARCREVAEAAADYTDNHHQRSDDHEFTALETKVEEWRIENERLLNIKRHRAAALTAEEREALAEVQRRIPSLAAVRSYDCEPYPWLVAAHAVLDRLTKGAR